jgi:hypothetical protein
MRRITFMRVKYHLKLLILFSYPLFLLGCISHYAVHQEIIPENLNGMGCIRGAITVTESKEPIYAASILLEGTNPIRGKSSDQNGNYLIKNLLPGKYYLRVSCVGFAQLKHYEVSVQADHVSIVNVELEEDNSYIHD